MVKKQVLGLQISVHDAKLVKVLDSTNDLLEELARLSLLKLLLLDDVVEELATTDELHDEEELLGCLNDLKQVNDGRVPDQFKYVNLASDSLHVSIPRDLALFKDFYCYLTGTKKQKHRSAHTNLIRMFSFATQ